MLAKASGIELSNLRSPLVMPFSIKAEKPPIKLTPTSLAALSKVCATLVRLSSSRLSANSAIGVTEILLLIIGIPNSFSMSLATLTRLAALVTIFS